MSANELFRDFSLLLNTLNKVEESLEMTFNCVSPNNFLRGEALWYNLVRFLSFFSNFSKIQGSSPFGRLRVRCGASFGRFRVRGGAS
jgi:hypothetical protein